mmetsp:Transcript_117878/g.334245  ORF Transcript_117878/g.334245 Transcript_117878/m.334245 type:complete len:265 (-) Transcript_117878:185-979(-)
MVPASARRPSPAPCLRTSCRACASPPGRKRKSQPPRARRCPFTPTMASISATTSACVRPTPCARISLSSHTSTMHAGCHCFSVCAAPRSTSTSWPSTSTLMTPTRAPGGMCSATTRSRVVVLRSQGSAADTSLSQPPKGPRAGGGLERPSPPAVTPMTRAMPVLHSFFAPAATVTEFPGALESTARATVTFCAAAPFSRTFLRRWSHVWRIISTARTRGHAPSHAAAMLCTPTCAPQSTKAAPCAQPARRRRTQLVTCGSNTPA